jgi:hypothetical protein
LSPFLQNIRIAIANGDVDGCVPVIDGEKWTSSLQLEVLDSWAPWMLDGQVAGYATYYNTEHGFSFVTVKGAGRSTVILISILQIRFIQIYYFLVALSLFELSLVPPRRAHDPSVQASCRASNVFSLLEWHQVLIMSCVCSSTFVVAKGEYLLSKPAQSWVYSIP